MMKWQPVVETVRNSDGTYDYLHLFDKVRQLDASAEKKIANVQSDQLLEQTSSFIDDVLIAVLIDDISAVIFCKVIQILYILVKMS